jgi:hypothetical protein
VTQVGFVPSLTPSATRHGSHFATVFHTKHEPSSRSGAVDAALNEPADNPVVQAAKDVAVRLEMKADDPWIVVLDRLDRLEALVASGRPPDAAWSQSRD